jgi:hypothetical protein
MYEHAYHTQHEKHSLGLGIDHFDRDWFLAWNSWNHFRSKDSRTIINGPISDQHSFGLFGDFSVKRGHNFIHGFNEGNFRPKSSVDVREFQTNVSGTNNGNPFRNELQFEGTVRRIHSLFIHLDAWWNEWDGSRCEENILSRTQSQNKEREPCECGVSGVPRVEAQSRKRRFDSSPSHIHIDTQRGTNPEG